MAVHGTQHLRALYTVFVRPALISRSSVLRSERTPPRCFPVLRHQPLSTSRPRLAIGRRGSKSTPQATQTLQLRDNDIPARRVRVVSEENQLSEPQTKFMVMRNIAPATHRLVCVTKPPRYLTPSHPDYDELAADYDSFVEQYAKQQARFGGEAAEGEDAEVESKHLPAILVLPSRYIRLPSGDEWIPVCKIENKAEVAARQRELAAAKKEQRKIAPEGVKAIELNWAIDANDLGHRLKKVEEFLRARRKVEILVAPKRRGRTATPEECDALLRRIAETVKNVEGAKESRPMQGKPGQVASLMLEGKREK